MKWFGIMLGATCLVVLSLFVVVEAFVPEPKTRVVIDGVNGRQSSTIQPGEVGKDIGSSAVPTYFAAQTLATLGDEQLFAGKLAGEKLFNRYQCVGCHADQGHALKKFENLGNKYNLQTIAAYMKRPVAPMPVFPLSDMDRENLAIYLISRYPGEPSG